ncbi:hypothetical protein ACFE04_016909 [Oxalis oulophora]
MSFSDSETNSFHSSDHKFFRQISRDRLLNEMLASSKTEDSKAWKVLIMDKVTVKVMSHSCKMADITDQGVSLVEELFKRRQPLPSMDAIYFIQPSKENVVMILSDMSGREPLYRKAFIFFSAPVAKELVNHLKCDMSIIPRIGALREMNMEYFPIDNQAFVTDQESALMEFFGQDPAENSRMYNASLNMMATRIATVFASLKEFPFVRYRSVRDESTATARDYLPSKLAAAIWETVQKYKSIPNYPQTETCELLILDRSVDQIAPVIHEWTYDAMCHDLLEMDGNKCTLEVPNKISGELEKKECLLEDHDPIWLELRNSHIADASERLHEKMTNFASKNKAAQMQRKGDGEISTRDLQKIVQALPQYGEVVEKLSLHVEIAGRINRIIRDTGLRDLGQLEQDLVFGDAAAKDVIGFLRKNSDATPENKLRLLMIYAIVYPEKFEGDKADKLMQLAKLSPEDMKVVNNMRILGGSSSSNVKKSSGSVFSLKFDDQKTKNQAARKDRSGEEEETWQLFRFFPVVEELIENLNKGELPKNEYACMNQAAAAPTTNSGSVRSNAGPVAPPERKVPAHSKRSRRTATWAKGHSSDDGTSSDSVLRRASMDFKNLGQRIFVFIIGGATRSELRACHKLTTKLRREIVLGSTSLDDPPQYITKLKLLTEKELLVPGPRF